MEALPKDKTNCSPRLVRVRMGMSSIESSRMLLVHRSSHSHAKLFDSVLWLAEGSGQHRNLQALPTPIPVLSFPYRTSFIGVEEVRAKAKLDARGTEFESL